MVEAGDSVIVFDLDDTLYAEHDYQTSGIKAVSEMMSGLYQRDILSNLLALRAQGEADLWSAACRILSVPETLAETMLWTYRLHIPDIKISDEVRSLLTRCEQRFSQVAILTDGRAVSQRLKLKALNLEHIPCYISQEYASTKPDEKRFQSIMNDFPAKRYIYVADNPNKDFIAPNALGWLTIGLILRDFHVHQYHLPDIAEAALPNHWIDSLPCAAGLIGIG